MALAAAEVDPGAGVLGLCSEKGALTKGFRPFKSSQVNTLPKAKRKTRSKQNKDMHKCSSVYSCLETLDEARGASNST